MPSVQTATKPRLIGEYLPCPPAEIDWALLVQSAELASGNLRRLGDILIEREQITREDLRDALDRQRVDRLRRCSFFEGLSGEDLRIIGSSAEEFTLAAGGRLLSQDQRGDSIYVVISGRLLIYRRDEHLEGIPAGVAVPGDAVGTADYFAGGTRHFSVCAVEPASLLKIRYDALPETFRLLPDGEARPARRLVNIEELMDRLTQRANRVLEAARSTLFLVDPEHGDLLSSTAIDEAGSETGQAAAAEFAAEVLKSGGIFTFPEAGRSSGADLEAGAQFQDGSRNSLASPLCSPKGEIIGAMQVAGRREGPFTTDDELLFRAFIHEVQAVVDNYRQTVKEARD